jgi:hypothetical protein
MRRTSRTPDNVSGELVRNSFSAPDTKATGDLSFPLDSLGIRRLARRGGTVTEEHRSTPRRRAELIDRVTLVRLAAVVSARCYVAEP